MARVRKRRKALKGSGLGIKSIMMMASTAADCSALAALRIAFLLLGAEKLPSTRRRERADLRSAHVTRVGCRLLDANERGVNPSKAIATPP
mmetsp:Transcript_34606/g.46643  ORF Transcript_34606/g.46643 Transcript_34606/m.46643 type:complete len:91 (+) Transcript_34606:122-394(+)|eukprot:scaffold92055_cov33-Tisochrysis_lutea.AAC.4